MTKDQETLDRRAKDVYDSVRRAKRKDEKVLCAIIDFAYDHYLSTHQVWKDYARAIKIHGKILF